MDSSLRRLQRGSNGEIDFYHSALEVYVPEGRFVIEMTPIRSRRRARRRLDPSSRCALAGVVVPIECNRSRSRGRGGDLGRPQRGDSYSKRRDRRYARPVARAWTVARFGAALGCGLLLAGTLAGCGGTKTVTKTVTVVGTVPNGGATSVSASVAAGAHDFAQFACAQCHGERGRGGVSTDVPALNVIGKQLTVAQLKQIINHGLGESANPTKPYMPVWGQVISTHQVADLVAYIRAGELL